MCTFNAAGYRRSRVQNFGPVLQVLQGGFSTEPLISYTDIYGATSCNNAIPVRIHNKLGYNTEKNLKLYFQKINGRVYLGP